MLQNTRRLDLKGFASRAGDPASCLRFSLPKKTLRSLLKERKVSQEAGNEGSHLYPFNQRQVYYFILTVMRERLEKETLACWISRGNLPSEECNCPDL